MSDKSCPKTLKAFEVERGHTREPPIPYIPVADEVAEAVTKTSGASGYKLDLPSGIKVTHALWESGNAEAFLKHVMAAMSYVTKKGYIKEYDAATSEAALAVHEARVREDLYLAAPPPAAAELAASATADAKVIEKTSPLWRLQGRCSYYTKIYLAKTLDTNGPLSWSPKSMQRRGRI